MIIKITCPECNTEGGFSLSDSSFDGPYKCWKCRALLNVSIVDGKLNSCEAMDQEEFDRQQEIQALRDKFKK